MKRQCCITVFLMLWFAVGMKAQLSPQDAAKGMKRGINIGNTMLLPAITAPSGAGVLARARPP